MPLQKLCEIEEKLQKDYIDIKNRYVKLKRCKYALLILKTSLISLSNGLSFINSLIMIVSSLCPVIDKIDKNKINLDVFDDLVFSDKNISLFFTQSRKLDVSCVFISHSFYRVDKLLSDNLNYIIFAKLDKREITSLYNNISLDLTLKQFQEITNNLKRYDFIIIDKLNDINFMKIRKNLNEILC